MAVKTDHFRVKKVQAENLPILTRVLQAAARALEQRGAPLWPLETLEPEALLNDYSESEMFLSFQNDEAVAGMILLEKDPFWPNAHMDESLFIHKLAVIPPAQGTGVAAQMLGFASARARAQGKRYLRLDCAAERPKLCAFYQVHGFVCIEETRVGPFHMAFYQQEVRA